MDNRTGQEYDNVYVKVRDAVKAIHVTNGIVRMQWCRRNPDLAIVMVRRGGTGRNDYVTWTCNLQTGGLSGGVYGTKEYAYNGYLDKCRLYD